LATGRHRLSFYFYENFDILVCKTSKRKYAGKFPGKTGGKTQLSSLYLFEKGVRL
jgi:hypothetical protein